MRLHSGFCCFEMTREDQLMIVNAMISSMTGFGSGKAEADGTTATVEMRSVNNRFCEVSVRMPRTMSAYESDLQTLVKKTFSRGRINVNVQIERTQEEVLPVQVDAKTAQAYHRLLTELREATGIDEPISLGHLLQFSEVFTPPEERPDAGEQGWAVVRSALAMAIEAMATMRGKEGAALQTELTGRLDGIESRLMIVEKYAPTRVEQARVRLRERLADLFRDERLNPDRLEIEITLLADRLDITEECVRLRSHLNLFREALASDVPVGRRLNFLTQEMNREVNTIGSKANDATIAHVVVDMKEELEKIREQVENTE